MTQEEFVAFYPQFAGFAPAVVMETYVGLANARFGSFSAVDAEEARRLYTAHKLTMYARVALPEGGTTATCPALLLPWKMPERPVWMGSTHISIRASRRPMRRSPLKAAG